MENISSVSISLDEEHDCISVLVGLTTLYLHGTYDAMRQLGRSIIEQANAREAKQPK